MIDYKKMYLELFNGVTDAIDILQKAQNNSENLYINSEKKPPINLKSINKNTEK